MPVPLITPNIKLSEKLKSKDRVKVDIPLDLYHCGHCGNIQLSDIVNPEIIYRNYLYETTVSMGLPDHFRALAENVVDFAKPKQGDLMVEIGSNDGTVLSYFKELGLTVLGVDPAKSIAERASARGLETLAAFFGVDLARRLRSERGGAKIIMANNVVANIDKMDDIAAGIFCLLAEDGVFVMETSYALDVFRDCLLDTVYHEHVSYFLVGPLDRFFKKNGLEIINVNRIATKGGSVRIVVQKIGGPQIPDPSVAGAIAEEKEAGMGDRNRLREMEVRIESIRTDLRAQLDSTGGGESAGYGASVGTQNLIHQLDIGSQIRYLVDDRPLTENLTGPGFDLPVVGSWRLLADRPSSIVLLAWRYADVIIAKNTEYLNKGGRFIVPLPDVEIVETLGRC